MSAAPDFAKQVERAVDTFAAVLKAAGCTHGDIVDVTTFRTDPAAQSAEIDAARLKDLPEKPYPNRTAVGVNWVAGFDVGIKVVARLPDPA